MWLPTLYWRKSWNISNLKFKSWNDSRTPTSIQRWYTKNVNDMPFMSRKLWFIFLRLLFKRINGEIAKCNARISISFQLYTMNCTKLSLNWDITFYCLPVVLNLTSKIVYRRTNFLRQITHSMCLKSFFRGFKQIKMSKYRWRLYISKPSSVTLRVEKKGGTFF